MYRVLLADDEQIERMALARRLMRRFGDSLQISEATDGKEAVELYQKEHSQIIIMDISMPELNGVEAAEQIRSMDEDCVIVFLTAYDEFSYAKRAIVIRALDYLLKPCDEEELAAVMEDPDAEAPKDPETERMNQVAEKIRTYIRENYMNEISMQDAARQFNYSDAYFCKLFKQCFDQNFTSYLTNFRINEAKRLLKDKNISIKDAGMKVGYYDSNYFAKVFKRVTGMIPSEYREAD